MSVAHVGPMRKLLPAIGVGSQKQIAAHVQGVGALSGCLARTLPRPRQCLASQLAARLAAVYGPRTGVISVGRVRVTIGLAVGAWQLRRIVSMSAEALGARAAVAHRRHQAPRDLVLSRQLHRCLSPRSSRLLSHSHSHSQRRNQAPQGYGIEVRSRVALRGSLRVAKATTPLSSSGVCGVLDA